MNDNIPGLKIEANDDGTITLEQDWAGNVDRVAVHTVHVRHLAERLGMVREVSASDAELLRTERGRVAALRQENDRLKRNMLRLQGHTLALQEDFRENADWRHADLTHEMNNINALVDLFDMAVDDFADQYSAHAPIGTPEGALPATPPETDGFGRPPKTGALCAAAAAAVTLRHATSRQRNGQAEDNCAAPLQLDLEGAHVG